MWTDGQLLDSCCGLYMYSKCINPLTLLTASEAFIFILEMIELEN